MLADVRKFSPKVGGAKKTQQQAEMARGKEQEADGHRHPYSGKGEWRKWATQ